MVDISSRLKLVPASPIRKLVPLADEAKQRGITVHHLNIGDPDIPTPQVMMETLRSWQTNPIPYANSQGDRELIEALVGYYQGINYPFIEAKNIQVSMGGSEALAMAMVGCCEAGDEILVFEPFFTGYASLAPVYGVTLVPVTTKIETGFHLPPKTEIEAKITPQTRAILLTNPNNPTGTVLTQGEVETILEIAKGHDLFVWADEVYREFVFDGKEGVSLLSYMQQMPEQIVILDSLSKRYSVTGLRLGAVVSLNQDLMAGVLRMAMGRLAVGWVDQKVAAKLSKVSQVEILQVRDEYQKRRDEVYEAARRMAGVTIQKPEGAFYAVLGLPVKSAEEFCAWLLTDFQDRGETVMLAPMPGFYATPGMGQNEVRIAYVLNTNKLSRSMELIKLALEKFTHQG